MRLTAGLLVFSIILLSLKANAAEEIIDIKLEPVVSFDEVPVGFIVNGYLKFETDVIITESNKVYINIEGLFRNLGIKCIQENESGVLTGFIENESKTYRIDFNANQITIGEKIIRAANGFMKESGAIYIESTVITEAFGLQIIFNYRSLSIKLESDFELPVIKQMRLEQMRQNVSKLQDNKVVADTVIQRDYHFFKFGTMDWSVSSFQTTGEKTNNRFFFGVGTELLYGQFNISAEYNDQYKFDKRRIDYNWRWVDNSKSAIKQAQLGKIYNQSISFLEAPVVGAAVSNAPTTLRKASGFYNINEYTEPNWTVELYLNDILVDFTTSDASGLFVFKVPIVYGYTTLKLKFYGPMGEERIEERTMNVPFTFLPAKSLEYSVSGGVLQDYDNSRFGKGVVNYGISNFLTMGAGVEYLSSIEFNPYIPYANIAFQPFSKLILNLEYAHNVRSKGLMSYYFGKSASVEVEYADYVKGQMATRFNADEELKVRVSFPFKKNAFSGFTKFNYNQRVYDAFNYNVFSAVFSEYYKNYSANLSANLNWMSDETPYFTTNLAVSYRMKGGLVIRPSAEYVVTDNRFLRFKAEIEKRVSKAYFALSYEKSLYFNTDNIFLSLRYDLPFARAGITSSYGNNKATFAESLQGSVAFGGGKTVKSGNNSALGKGGILFYPFLDLNQNGVFDKGEQMVLLSTVKVSGGMAVISEKDSIVRVSDLNAFVDYRVEFNDNDLENIAWHFKHKTYQVLVDPNQYKQVYVPVISVGEISGMVYLNKDDAMNGLGRITIQIIDEQGNKVAETLSESDGYYNYLGLKPGSYNIRIDENQIEKLEFHSTPLQQKVVIKALVGGDIVNGLDFVLQKKKTTSEAIEVPVEVIKMAVKTTPRPGQHEAEKTTGTKASELRDPKKPEEPKPAPAKINNTGSDQKNKAEQKPPADTQAKESGDVAFQNVSALEGLFYSVQIGVFKNRVSAKQLLNLSPIFYEVLPNGTTRYVCGRFASKAEAEAAKQTIIAKGIKGAFVVTYRNGEKIALVNCSLNDMETDSLYDNDIAEDIDIVCIKVNE